MKKNKNEEVEVVNEEFEEIQEEEEVEVKEKKDWKKIGKKILKWTLLGAAGVAGVILVNAVANGGKEEEADEETETESNNLGELKTYEARIECYENAKDDLEEILSTELKEVEKTEE